MRKQKEQSGILGKIKNRIWNVWTFINKKALHNAYEECSDFEDLSPKSNAKYVDEYIKALHWGLKNDSVSNIALAGPYGSGKSSIIQTYMKKYPRTKAISISLATFDAEHLSEEKREIEIEQGVLKQLFYKVDSKKIPQSRYRKLKKKYYWSYFLLTLCVVLTLLLGCAYFFPEFSKKCVEHIIQNGEAYNLDLLHSIIIMCMFFFIGILGVSYILKWGSSKLRLKEVTIVDKATVSTDYELDSAFNKNMDEIIYFFEETKYDTVFIEDLDRFNNTEIFVRLRELNTVLNNYDLINYRITFVYAIRDDMFVDSERTKFFDFIIPIIPIINSTNSGEMLREKLEIETLENGLIKSGKYDISASFINLIAPFIEDMRVLINICNEFVIYKKTLVSNHLKDEEMFSIIVFKNLYPKDFADIEMEKGIIKQAFIDKKNIVLEKQKILKEQNDELEGILKGIKKDILEDVKELKAAFFSFLMQGKGAFVKCNISGKNYQVDEIMSDEFDMDILWSKNSVTVYNQRNENFYISNIESLMRDRNKNYKQRFFYLSNCGVVKQNKIREEIQKNNRCVSAIQSWTLRQLIEKYGSEITFSPKVKENELLLFMLRKGYINENYADYINYFHPNSISIDEMRFIRCIRMQEFLGDFAYPIRNVARVCECIEKYEFGQKEVLNFNIVDYLITEKAHDEKCIEIFKMLANESNVSFKFIRDYINREKNLNAFTNILCKQYEGFWRFVFNDVSLSEDVKYQYLSLILNYADISDIVKLNYYENYNDIEYEDEIVFEERICGWIEEALLAKQALSKLSSVDSEKMIQVINELDVVFVDVDINGASDDVLTYIFDEGLYRINKFMPRRLFEYKFSDKLSMFETANYSLLMELRPQPLLNMIYKDFETYIEEIVIGQKDNIKESPSAVEDMLKQLMSKDAEELCLKVLDKENIYWNDLEECCFNVPEDQHNIRKSIWEHIMQGNKLKGTWKSFTIYHEVYGLTSELVNWMDNMSNEICRSVKNEKITDEIIKGLLVKLSSVNAFENVIESCPIEDFDIRLKECSLEKIEVMIRKGYIPFSTVQLNEIIEVAPQYVVQYVVLHKNSFFANASTLVLQMKIVNELLSSNEFDESEIKILLQVLGNQKIDQDMAITLSKIEFCIDKELSEKAWALLEEEDRKVLLINQLDVYSLDEIANKLNELSEEFSSLSDATRRHKEHILIDSLGYNQLLLAKLKEKNYLTSVEVIPYEEKNGNSNNSVAGKCFEVWVKQRNS